MEDVNLGLGRTAEHEIEVAVAIEISAAGPVGHLCGEGNRVGRLEPAVVLVKEGTRVAGGGVVGRINQ